MNILKCWICIECRINIKLNRHFYGLISMKKLLLKAKTFDFIKVYGSFVWRDIICRDPNQICVTQIFKLIESKTVLSHKQLNFALKWFEMPKKIAVHISIESHFDSTICRDLGFFKGNTGCSSVACALTENAIQWNRSKSKT